MAAVLRRFLEKLVRPPKIYPELDMEVERRLRLLERAREPAWSYRVVEEYSVAAGTVRILERRDTGERYYWVLEPELSEKEKRLYAALMKILMVEAEPPPTPAAASAHYVAEVARVLDKYLPAGVSEEIDEMLRKMTYYMVRDSAGYGPLEIPMQDPEIEDVEIYGTPPGQTQPVPVIVVHARYGRMQTNIVFPTQRDIDDYVFALSSRTPRPASLATPMIDASLPDGSRIAGTFLKEISMSGSTITIRKLKRPRSAVELMVESGSFPPEMIAWFWMCAESGIRTAVIGGIGEGKTTLLNSMLMMIRPEQKIVIVEETPELHSPHIYTLKLYTRTGGLAGKELMDLLRLALRLRPDIVVVGEIRGEEAYVLFQAAALGHTTLTTIHAAGPEELYRRLTAPPMNIPEGHLGLLEQVVLVRRFEEQGFIRRVAGVWEVNLPEKIEPLFEYDPVEDKWSFDIEKLFGGRIGEKIMRARRGATKQDLISDFYRRTALVKALADRRITEYGRVAAAFRMYLRSPLAPIDDIVEAAMRAG